MYTFGPAPRLTQVQGSIENLERGIQRRRQESQAARERLEEFRNVLEVLKNTLGNSAGALVRKRAENLNLTAQIEEKRVNLETARRKYQVITTSPETSRDLRKDVGGEG